MPGSKRRALKKLLSPITSPHSKPTSPPPLSTSPSSNSNNLPSMTLSPQSSNISHSSSSNTTMQNLSNSLLHSHNQPQSQSFSSITSDPGNYLTDKQLKDDLEVEEKLDHLSGSTGGESGLGMGLEAAGGPTVSQTGYQDGVGAGVEAKSNGGNGIIHSNSIGNGNGTGKGNETNGHEEEGGHGRKKKSSKQRFAEREARKREALLASAPPADPAWTAQLEKERLEEIRVISDACVALGREIYEIDPDGHCMYSAIADQLIHLNLLPNTSSYHTTRQIAAEYMTKNPDEFIPFLPSIGGEDSAGATDDGVMSLDDFKIYCERVRGSGEWGGEPEIQALSKAFKTPIHVIQRGPPTVVSHGGLDDSFGGAMTPEQSASLGDKVIRITYHRRMYGLGEHYNSLRKIYMEKHSILESMFR